MRLIDVDALYLMEYEPNTVMNTAQTLAHNEVVRMVLSAPTIDTTVYAKWIADRYGQKFCSHCKSNYPNAENLIRINYCPNCGAKMDLQDRMKENNNYEF